MTQRRINMQNLLLTFLLTLIPAGAWGQTWIEISDATNLTTQFNNSGTTYIKLSADITGYGFVVKSGNTVFLDLHGHTITKDNPHGNYSDFVGNVTVEADDSMNVDKDDDTGQEDAE